MLNGQAQLLRVATLNAFFRIGPTMRSCYHPALPAVIGKDALRQYLQTSLQIPGFRITWESTEVISSPDGKLAYMFGSNLVSMADPDGRPLSTQAAQSPFGGARRTTNGVAP
jgi:hypothetical protein